MSLELLQLLAGNEKEFAKGLVDLGWYNYTPRLTDYCFTGKARKALTPRFISAGEVRDSDVWVYKLELLNGNWQDAVAIVESQLKIEPHFAVVFCRINDGMLILVPTNPEKAFRKAKGGLAVDRIFLDIKKPSNFEMETLKRLADAPSVGFKARLQEVINTERVTKSFYEKFKTHLNSFKQEIQGIPTEYDRQWYSSLMLNRLMFLYFLQRKGFLDNNYNYLKEKLQEISANKGKDKFQSFYRCFLLRLFHEGLGSHIRSVDFEDFIGRIPYLNGGLFEIHTIERAYEDKNGNISIDIPDKAFRSIFDFFDGYEWCLDTRPSRTEKEINPDILGYIFEKFVNQKQMGAYYTKEDITGYITRNSIIPFVFEEIDKSGEVCSWLQKTAKEDPLRYLYEEQIKGIELELPAYTNDNMNVNADEEYALPGETWREVINRRNRCKSAIMVLQSDDMYSIDQLITLNVDIEKFASDYIEHVNNTDTVLNIWSRISGYVIHEGMESKPLTILDPTCGSGAFLFSALNILEPLYHRCIERMKLLIQTEPHGSRYEVTNNKVKEILDHICDTKRHPNEKYYILKNIILNNLYGVDIMPEAVEICKLRLYLKLVSVVEPIVDRDNFGLEPLPDMDFNIKAGNTLVGYYDIRDAERDLSQKLNFGEEAEGFLTKAREADRAFIEYRRRQIVGTLGGVLENKTKLKERLEELNKVMSINLSVTYGSYYKDKYNSWVSSHQPFHWATEFYGIMKQGGFDIVIGNPPYVSYTKKDKLTRKSIEDVYTIKGYETESCNNLYAFVIERSMKLLKENGRMGMIIPISSVSSDSYRPLYRLLETNKLWLSSYSNRPAKMFEGVEQRLTIMIMKNSGQPAVFSTPYQHWYENERKCLFHRLQYCQATIWTKSGMPIKSGVTVAETIFNKLETKNRNLDTLCERGSHSAYYHDGPTYWVRAMPFKPNPGQNNSRSNHYHCIPTSSEEEAILIASIMNSSTFYFFFKMISNCRDLGQREWTYFPVGKMQDDIRRRIVEIGERLKNNYIATAEWCTRNYPSGSIRYQEYYPARSKMVINEIDEILAIHYGFSDEERDYLINYEFKYRNNIDETLQETTESE